MRRIGWCTLRSRRLWVLPAISPRTATTVDNCCRMSAGSLTVRRIMISSTSSSSSSKLASLSTFSPYCSLELPSSSLSSWSSPSVTPLIMKRSRRSGTGDMRVTCEVRVLARRLLVTKASSPSSILRRAGVHSRPYQGRLAAEHPDLWRSCCTR